MVLFGFWINLEDQSANIHPDTSIPSVTVEQQPAGRLHRQGARPPDGEQEVGAEEGDRGGGAGGLEGGDDRLLLLQVKEVQSVQSMYQKEREDLKRAIEEMQKKFNQLKVHCSFVFFG